mmetsp:Transcript_8381/g.22359  ORF Transcript_8381/g.22359 Transcript_8381/m.22359 type:complete len:321 (-) Transcript_8381:3178-4140(-)
MRTCKCVHIYIFERGWTRKKGKKRKRLTVGSNISIILKIHPGLTVCTCSFFLISLHSKSAAERSPSSSNAASTTLFTVAGGFEYDLISSKCDRLAVRSFLSIFLFIFLSLTLFASMDSFSSSSSSSITDGTCTASSSSSFSKFSCTRPIELATLLRKERSDCEKHFCSTSGRRHLLRILRALSRAAVLASSTSSFCSFFSSFSSPLLTSASTSPPFSSCSVATLSAGTPSSLAFSTFGGVLARFSSTLSAFFSPSSSPFSFSFSFSSPSFSSFSPSSSSTSATSLFTSSSIFSFKSSATSSSPSSSTSTSLSDGRESNGS